jgi:hypothetical protein
MTSRDLAQQLAEEECSWHLSVGCREPAWSDEATCVAQRSAELRQAYDDAEARGRRFDAECAEEILGPSRPSGCTSLCSVYVGDKRLNEACSDDGAGSDCGPSLTCIQGACVDSSAIGLVTEGETCIDDAGRPTRVCQTGLLCDDQGSGTCVRGPAAGEACIDGVRCAVGSYCAYDDRVCQPLRAAGEPCQSPIECESVSCESGACEASVPFWCTNDHLVYSDGCLERV